MVQLTKNASEMECQPLNLLPMVLYGGRRLSPILFTVYLDDLSISKSFGIGCPRDGLFAGAVSYADDIALLAPSLSTLRLMFKHCEEFATSTGLSFN